MSTEAPHAPTWHVPGWLRDADDEAFLARVPQEPLSDEDEAERKKRGSVYVHREMRDPAARPLALRIPKPADKPEEPAKE